ncbi:hypothetical protein V5F49_13595 [Xanthobacter sp. V3C-3]|uniref:hypothetical protein n=1 Tax=Xanthobacter lutulentifluminis TaxID=3119935 RepID=UPI00372CC2F9
MPANLPETAHGTAPRARRVLVLPSPGATHLCASALVGGLMFLMASAVPAPTFAQGASPPATTGACDQPPHEPATPPARGADSGTRPGSEGSTAWTGGTGGSYTGLTPQSGTPASPDRQPEVVTGADPKPEPQARC